MAAEVFESLGEFENGIIAATKDISTFSTHVYVFIEANASRGRCLAKLGRTADAEDALNTAADAAMRFAMPFWEMLVRCDLITHVLDPMGRRDEQLAPLGKCIDGMCRPPMEYTSILGSGLDAEAAVIAHKNACSDATHGTI